MNKHLLICSLVICTAFLFLFEGCNNQSTNPVQNNQTSGATKTFTSSSVDYLEYDGFDVVIRQNTVPRDSAGNPGTIVISMNTSTTLDQGIPAIQNGFTPVSKYVRVGPEGFTFNLPVKIGLPGGNASSAAKLYVLEYFPSTNDWRIIPGSSLDSVRKQVLIDVLQLGYFVLAQKSSDDWQAPYGGVQYCQVDGITHYMLTVNSVTLSNPNDINFYPNGLVGLTFISINWPGSDYVTGPCRGLLPFGSYTFWLSYRQSYTDQIYTYSSPIPLVITNPLNYPTLAWSMDDVTGWTILCGLPPGGSWMPGRPTVWPPPSVPYGSGTFQATLTWLNNSSNDADLDLHLYGPNGLHIWYGNKTSANFALDRDWQLDLGNATENIYSLTSTIPSGSYTVKVAHYAGDPMYFNCRTILNGSSSNYSASISSGDVTCKTFNIP